MFVLIGIPRLINTSFATSAYMKGGKETNGLVTDANDLKALKTILSGFAYKDSPACMFDTDVSVTLTNGRKNITFCPAFCADPLVEIDQTGKYLHMSQNQRRALDRTGKESGLVF